MAEHSRNLNEACGSNFTNNYIQCDNFGHPSQAQNFPPNVQSGMFTRPPPPVFPDYHRIPPAPLSLPPPQLSLPPPSLSVPPQSVLSQPMVQVPERISASSESKYYGNEASSFAQSCSSVSFQQQPFHTQNLPLPVSGFSYMQNFGIPPQQPDTILPLPCIQQNEGEHMCESESKIDEYWIKNWLKNIKISKTENIKQTEMTDKCTALSSTELKIYEVKEKVNKVSKLLAELENSCKSLSVIYKSLSDNEWSSRCAEIEEKKEKLSDLLGSLINDEKGIQSVKQKLLKRKKKRERQRRKREEWKQEKIENSMKRQQLHQNIDRWLENMKDCVERGRRDEELKREADSVLSDVTRKKTEAKRQVALLSALLKLREARVTAQKAMGRNVSQQQTDAFNSVIERLKALWNRQLKELSLEEQGLKVMLNEAAAEEKNNETIRKKEILRDWEMAIFGDTKTSEYQPHDFNEFIAVRKQWDQFVVDEGTVMSSSIPPGWILPTKGSHPDWTKFSKAHSLS